LAQEGPGRVPPRETEGTGVIGPQVVGAEAPRGLFLATSEDYDMATDKLRLGQQEITVSRKRGNS